MNTNIPLYAAFVAQIESVLTTFGRNDIKAAIGDSVANNRTVTINQLIRFLGTRRKPAFRALGTQLAAVYGLPTVSGLLTGNRSGLARTDAFDINELLYVINNQTSAKRAVSRALAA